MAAAVFLSSTCLTTPLLNGLGFASSAQAEVQCSQSQFGENLPGYTAFLEVRDAAVAYYCKPETGSITSNGIGFQIFVSETNPNISDKTPSSLSLDNRINIDAALLSPSVGVGYGVEVYSKGNDGSGRPGADMAIYNSAAIAAISGILESPMTGISARSYAGAGPNGGNGHGFTSGKDGGRGGDGGTILISNRHGAQIKVLGRYGAGIYAESLGGNGGDGGDAGNLGGSGGSGGLGGNGGSVTIRNAGHIETGRTDKFSIDFNPFTYSPGIHARSVGGSGGQGGSSGWMPYSSGGHGGAGNSGGELDITNSGSIITHTDNSDGILVETIGGNGGDGGSSLQNRLLSIGASGGQAGNGGKTTISNTGTVTTRGDYAHGLSLHAIGGGGGAGTNARLLTKGIGLAIGGSGGEGGFGGKISGSLHGRITTSGQGSHGVLAQAVGGGGGDGGNAETLAYSTGPALAAGFGGTGGGGGQGGDVVLNLATGSEIQTGVGAQGGSGLGAFGLLAQSIGGGGGNGGHAYSGSLSVNEASAFSTALSFGGSGGSGGQGRLSQVTSAGKIATNGHMAAGLLAQSIGGGGGAGGNALSLAAAAALKNSGSFALAFGGSGGSGGHGGEVKVILESGGSIVTAGNYADALISQSVGGGGGMGGNALTLATGLSEKSYDATLTMGGTGGNGGHGGAATFVNNGQTITTHGHQSSGVVVQSIGGGGGVGGHAENFAINLTGSNGQEGTNTKSVHLTLGGRGGSGGDGLFVNVDNQSFMTTHGANARGMVVQSIGGGGGLGGSVSNNSFRGDVGRLGGTGETRNVALNLGGDGGSGGGSGKVSVKFSGDIRTSGALSDGLLAQSISGGGGAGGSVFSETAEGFANSQTPPTKNSMSLDMQLGGKGGQGGRAGDVAVTIGTRQSTQIATGGEHAIGIVAQSIAAGGGRAGTASNQGFTTETQVPQFGAQVTSTVSQLASNLAHIAGFTGVGARNDTQQGSSVAGDVSVHTTEDKYSTITNFGRGAHGMLAQSIAGGGGSGGVSYLDPAVTIDTGATGSGSGHIQFEIGGHNLQSAMSGSVDIDTYQAISTYGVGASGIVAQSIAGGGGEYFQAGRTNSDVAKNSAIGAFNLEKATSGQVTVTGESKIQTSADIAHGIVAQSIAGGGGMATIAEGGMAADAGALRFGGANAGSTDYRINGDPAGNVTIKRGGSIVTTGNHSMGILAQAIGGGGGVLQFGAVGASSIEKSKINPAVSGGLGGHITIDDSDSALNITTAGTGAHAIFAQSIGGGGGLLLANGQKFGGRETTSLHGGTGRLSTQGGVTIASQGNIATTGDYAFGIFAQSETNSALVVQGDDGMSFMRGQMPVDQASGLSAANTTGVSTFGGPVRIDQSGQIKTAGTGAHGIYVKTMAGRPDTAVINLDGTVEVTGTGARAFKFENAYFRDGNFSKDFAVQKIDTATITIGSDAHIKADAQPGLVALDIYDNYGALTVDVHGTVNDPSNFAASLSNTAVSMNGNGNLNIHQGGSVTGRLQGTWDQFRNPSVSIAGLVTGAVHAFYNYDLQAGGVHNLPVDPSLTGGSYGQSLNVSQIARADGDVRPYLTQFRSSGNSHRVIQAAHADRFDVSRFSGTAATTFRFSQTGQSSIDFDGYDIDFKRVTGGDLHLDTAATRMNRLVETFRSASPSFSGDEELHDILLAAANSHDEALTRIIVGGFVPSGNMNSSKLIMLENLRINHALHSCGVAFGTFANLQESDCGWVRWHSDFVGDHASNTHMVHHGLSFGGQRAINDH